MPHCPTPTPAAPPHYLFNIGNYLPEELLHFINLLEKALGRTAIKHLEAMQPGDAVATAADTSSLEAWLGIRPTTPLELGVELFAEWYLQYAIS